MSLETNPRYFVYQAHKSGIFYEELQEACISLGKEKVCTMLNYYQAGSGIDTVSPSLLDSWLATFRYVEANPEEPDLDKKIDRYIETTEAWEYIITVIRTPIPSDRVAMWSSFSAEQLESEAEYLEYKLDIHSGKSQSRLRLELEDVIERRRQNIWIKREFNQYLDRMAKILESNYNWDYATKYSTIYLVYIGNGLVSLRSCSGRLVKSDMLDIAEYLKYPQFRVLKGYEATSMHLEVIIREVRRRLATDLVVRSSHRPIGYRDEVVYRLTRPFEDFASVVKQIIFESDLYRRIEELEKAVFNS